MNVWQSLPWRLGIQSLPPRSTSRIHCLPRSLTVKRRFTISPFDILLIDLQFSTHSSFPIAVLHFAVAIFEWGWPANWLFTTFIAVVWDCLQGLLRLKKPRDGSRIFQMRVPKTFCSPWDHFLRERGKGSRLPKRLPGLMWNSSSFLLAMNDSALGLCYRLPQPPMLRWSWCLSH